MEYTDTQLYYFARAALERGDLSSAEMLLLKSWRSFRHAKTAYWLGHICLKQKRVDEARDWLLEAFNENPRNNAIALAHAEHLVSDKELERAITVLEAVIEQNATYKPAVLLLNRIRSSR